MKARLSALMDGELESHELTPVFEALSRDEALRTEWSRYQVVGDALRQEPELCRDLSASVMAALHNEPTVMAPRRPMPSVAGERQWRGMMAMAASLAGVAVVGWMAFGQAGQIGPATDAGRLAVAKQSSASLVASAAPKAPNGRMQEYLVAHQTYSPGGEMQSGTRYIRTVSVAR